MALSDQLISNVLGLGTDPLQYALASTLHVNAVGGFISKSRSQESEGDLHAASAAAKLIEKGYAHDHPTVVALNAKIEGSAAVTKDAIDWVKSIRQPTQGGLLNG